MAKIKTLTRAEKESAEIITCITELKPFVDKHKINPYKIGVPENIPLTQKEIDQEHESKTHTYWAIEDKIFLLITLY